MRKNVWTRGLPLLMVCVLGVSAAVLPAAQAAPARPLTASVFLLLAQETVELPIGSAGVMLRTAALSADLLRLCEQDSFGQKDESDLLRLTETALDSLTDEEKDLFMYNFEKQIVPFCDGVLAGDPVCLDYLSDAGVALAGEAPGDRECWELLKEAVLSQK